VCICVWGGGRGGALCTQWGACIGGHVSVCHHLVYACVCFLDRLYHLSHLRHHVFLLALSAAACAACLQQQKSKWEKLLQQPAIYAESLGYFVDPPASEADHLMLPPMKDADLDAFINSGGQQLYAPGPAAPTQPAAAPISVPGMPSQPANDVEAAWMSLFLENHLWNDQRDTVSCCFFGPAAVAPAGQQSTRCCCGQQRRMLQRCCQRHISMHSCVCAIRVYSANFGLLRSANPASTARQTCLQAPADRWISSLPPLHACTSTENGQAA
jgi:hypothetical protein